jgi:hypothetical protein
MLARLEPRLTRRFDALLRRLRELEEAPDDAPAEGG